MMRRKDYFLFIILFIGILGFYFLCITNIDLFITHYDSKIMSYENKYKAEKIYNNIIATLLNNSKITVSTIDDLEEIISSDYLIDILSYFLNLTKKETINYLKESINKKQINTLYSSYYKEKIIYITNPNYVIIFTMDGKNVYYNKYLDGETCREINDDTASENIDNISSNTNRIMDTIGIKKNIGFEITSIRKAYDFEYNDEFSRVYFIFDKKNNIKITYNLDCNVIYILELGFKELNELDKNETVTIVKP